MENKDFCIFIISHGRSDCIYTLDTLKKSNYTGDLYIVIDDEDKTQNEYIKKYGADIVKVFNKKYYADLIDEGNNFDNRRTTTHARNACFDIAQNLRYQYFMVLDDDYKAFDYRIDTNSTENRGDIKPIKNLDKILDLLLDYYKSIPALSIAFAQGGDFIGGINNGKGAYRFNKRKCMNSFICSLNKRYNFIGQLNEDVNTYVTLGSKGDLFLTIPFVSLTQNQTQKTKGGMTDAYLKYGTYIKSFTTTMMHPSSVKVSMMQAANQRIHHSIKWANTTPMILNERHKKQ